MLSPTIVKIGLVVVGLTTGVISTGVGAWLTLGRKVVTQEQLDTKVEQVVDAELAAFASRVQLMDAMNSRLQDVAEDVSAIKARQDDIYNYIVRLDGKLDRHMAEQEDNGS
jgi:hypothetical protein